MMVLVLNPHPTLSPRERALGLSPGDGAGGCDPHPTLSPRERAFLLRHAWAVEGAGVAVGGLGDFAVGGHLVDGMGEELGELVQEVVGW